MERSPSRATTAQSPSKRREGEGIRVVCRFRPMSDLELEQNGGESIHIEDENTVTVKIEDSEHKFTFDKVLDKWATQQDVYEASAEPLIEGVLNGFNSAIIAYGQTGSGKTFTMSGPLFEDPRKTEYALRQNTKGIIPRLVEDLFYHINQAPPDVEYHVTASYIEIYQEKLKDLLRPPIKLPITATTAEKLAHIRKTKLEIQDSPNSGGIWITNAVQIPVTNTYEVTSVMAQGSEQRIIAATNSNEESSRSHTIFLMTIEKKDFREGEGVTKLSHLYLVDLAGSEKVSKTGASGARLEEAKVINKSLLSLGNVIAALSTNSSFVPYRDSKLTRILQNSFGGNSKTTLIITCSPHSWNSKETLSTLRFGDRSKTIQNTPVANEERNIDQLKLLLAKERSQNEKLLQYIFQLENELKMYKDGNNVPQSPRPSTSTSTTTSTVTPKKESVLTLTKNRILSSFELFSFLCPLSGDIMSDPVVAQDGITYEKKNIEKWMKTNTKSPISHATLSSKQLVPNYALKRQIYGHFPTEESRKFHRTNFFVYVPNDIMLLILNQLDAQSLCRLCQVCSSFKGMESMYQERLWSGICENLGITEKNESWKQAAKEAWIKTHEKKMQKAVSNPSGGLLLTRA